VLLVAHAADIYYEAKKVEREEREKKEEKKRFSAVHFVILFQSGCIGPYMFTSLY